MVRVLTTEEVADLLRIAGILAYPIYDKDEWIFCSTPGCTLPGGHGGDCKPAGSR